MNDQEIIQRAERIAAGWPARPATAERVRHRCAILALAPDGPAALRLTIAIDAPSQRASLHIPGQYATIEPPGIEPRFSVIAQAPDPDAPSWDLLITRDSTLGNALSAMRVGDHLIVSEAEGPGFDVDRIAGGPLLIFATGTGIATARPVIQHIERRDASTLKRTSIYYGERRWDMFAYSDEIARWIGAGCAVWRVSEVGEDGQPTPLRYLQHALARDVSDDLSQATALLAGAPPMLRAVSAALMTRGMPPEQILTNF